MSTVLVLDSSTRNRRFITDALSTSGHLALEAATGAELADVLAVALPDLIVTPIDSHDRNEFGLDGTGGVALPRGCPIVLYTKRVLAQVDPGGAGRSPGGHAPFADLVEAVDDYLYVAGLSRTVAG